MIYVVVKNFVSEGRPTTVVLSEHPDYGPCWSEASITHPYTLRYADREDATNEVAIYGGTIREVSDELYSWLVEQNKLDMELCPC